VFIALPECFVLVLCRIPPWSDQYDSGDVSPCPDPFLDGIHDRYQANAFFGQRILHPWWYLCKGLPFDNAKLAHLNQSIGQGLGTSINLPLQAIESHRLVVDQYPDDVKGMFLSHNPYDSFIDTGVITEDGWVLSTSLFFLFLGHQAHFFTPIPSV
jgi:hypothetical protein